MFKQNRKMYKIYKQNNMNIHIILQILGPLDRILIKFHNDNFSMIELIQ